MPAGPPPTMQQVVWTVSVGIGEAYATQSFFCKLVEDVVYWNTNFLSG
jgi:hypothetical protein